MPEDESRVDVAGSLCWLTVAFVGLVTITQTIGWTGTTIIAVVQALTPYLALTLVPVVAIGLVQRRSVLVATAAAAGFGMLILAAPLAFPDRQPAPADGATGMRVAGINLLYSNDRVADVAEQLSQQAPDVIAFTEYTTEHATTLLAGPLATQYRYRTDRAGPYGAGVAVWSRLPFALADDPDTYHSSIDLTVRGPDGNIRIIAVHMPTPVSNFDDWRHDLGIADEIGRTTTTPTLLIGDLNASYWHPDFRRLLDTGFVDAHIAAGSGFSVSWPTNQLIPPFVRLDHALTIGGLVSTTIDDIDVAGSDHRGLIVTVAPARPAAP